MPSPKNPGKPKPVANAQSGEFSVLAQAKVQQVVHREGGYTICLNNGSAFHVESPIVAEWLKPGRTIEVAIREVK